MSNTYFNATIVCSTDSRASVNFQTYHAFCFYFWQGQLPAALALPDLFANFYGHVTNFMFSCNFFVQFFKNWRNSANWRAKCTPVIAPYGLN